MSDLDIDNFLMRKGGYGSESDGSNDEIDSFLTRKDKFADQVIEPEGRIDDFLMRKSEPVSPIDVPTAADFEPAQSKTEVGTLTQTSQALVGEFIDLLGLPGEAANWAMEKAGLETRFQTGETLRELGAQAGLTTRAGEAEDTAATKVGQYLGMGLEFLAPFVTLGKAATMARATAGAVTPATGKATQVLAPKTTKVGIAKDIGAAMAVPFVQAPKLAAISEVGGGVGAGLGAYYGGKEYGPTGEVVGGLLGGGFAQISPALATAGARQARKSLFPMTKAGGKVRAAEEIQRLAETKPENIIGTIANEAQTTLKGTDISPARLSGDKHLIAMEQKLLNENPQLAPVFELKRARVNDLARAEMQRIGGDVPIEQTQAYLKWRTEHIEGLIDKQLDSTLVKARDSLNNLSPTTSRVAANKVVNEQVNASLTKAREIETKAWNDVDKTIVTSTSEGRDVFMKELSSRAPAANPKEIESFIPEFFGSFNQQGEWELGKFGVEETVHQLTTFRSRLTTAMREEAGKDAPNWNKHRIMDDVQEGILRDLGKVEGQSNLNHAISVSRKLNEKFKSGTLNTILGHHKTGGKLAPELTLESISEGSKAGVKVKEILEASPESKPMIEDFLKSQMANKLIDKVSGRLKVKAAKTYIDGNEMLLKTFPALKSSLEHAIGQEERAASTLLKGKAAKKQLLSSSIAKIGGMKPGRVMTEILSSQKPQQAMKEAIAKSNQAGRAGIKNDIMAYLLHKSRTGSFNENNIPMHSGRRMAFEWAENKRVFAEALTQAESQRIDTVINTLIKNEDVKLPEIGEVVAPTKGLLLFAAKILAAQRGADIGRSIGTATIQVPHYFAKLAENTFGRMDTGAAKQLLTDAIQDKKLFEALLLDISKPVHANKVYKVLQGWMLAHSVKSLEDVSEQ